VRCNVLKSSKVTITSKIVSQMTQYVYDYPMTDDAVYYISKVNIPTSTVTHKLLCRATW